jgi:hypothetical protein
VPVGSASPLAKLAQYGARHHPERSRFSTWKNYGGCAVKLVTTASTAGVRADRAAAAQTLEFALVQDAQELGLKFKRDFTNFVEKYSAPVREFKAANALRDGSGESTFLVP